MLLSLLVRVALLHFSPAFSDSDDVYRSKNSHDYVPCNSGWHYFSGSCYKVVPRRAANRYTWSEALALCRGLGGDLVSIQSQAEQDFVVAYLQLDLAGDWTFWIGLNDREKEGDFKWSDGSVYNYSNFYENEPSGRGPQGDDEDCVHMGFEPPYDVVGQWNDLACELYRKYATCEMDSNPIRKSPNLMYCSPEEGGGWKHKSSCYHIVTEHKSWQNAEKHCKDNFNGHLLTIHDTLEDLFLQLALPDIKSEIWIGMKIQAQLQQKWTSGWYVSYDRFSDDERFLAGSCAVRESRTEWFTLPCSEQLPFICEVSKATPPVLKPSQVGSYCPTEMDDWRDLGGDYCYYIKTLTSVNFNEANFDCIRRGGNLLSLHSQEEADILHPFVKHKGQSILIGLLRLKGNNEEMFGWSDGSVLDYQKWGSDEPDDVEEKCVDATTLTMDWRDRMCDSKFSGYICSVRKVVSTSRLVDESSDCDNFCIAPETHLHAILSQSSEAKRVSCKRG